MLWTVFAVRGRRLEGDGKIAGKSQRPSDVPYIPCA